MTRIELKGQHFGRLTVAGYHGSRHGQAYWDCECECGGKAVVSSGHLRSGHTQSCGCIRAEAAGGLHRSHGKSSEPVYRVWWEMRRRCTVPNHKDFKYYGGRGITVCQEWQESFEAFYEHVSVLPHYGEKGRSLDRVNNDKNYEPGNVRWATAVQQAQNRRRRISA